MLMLLVRGSHSENHCYHLSLRSLPVLSQHWPEGIVTSHISATFCFPRKITASDSASLFILHSHHVPSYSILSDTLVAAFKGTYFSQIKGNSYVCVYLIKHLSDIILSTIFICNGCSLRRQIKW